MLLVGDDPFVEFHAKQSIALSVVLVALSIGLSIVFTILGFIPVIGDLFGILTVLLWPLLSLGGLALTAFMIYKAYAGEWYKLPYIGDFVANQ